jgi:photosystem II stability/assembly factor-like uncharacterized protein
VGKGARFVIALSAMTVAVAGCTNAPDGTQSADYPQPSQRHSSAASPRDWASEVYSMRLYPSGFGLVGVSSAAAGSGGPRLLATTDFGATFRDLGPLTRPGTVVDDRAALGDSRLWLLTWDPDSTRSRLYRSADAGRSWSSAGVPGHNASAGSTDSIDFVDGNRGWLVKQMPNGEVSALYKTTDGGARWQRVNRRLPQVAPVVVDPAGDLWQAGGFFSDRLVHSTDGGRTWTPVELTHAPRRGDQLRYSLPAFFGDQILEAVGVFTDHGETLRVYHSRDGGRAWRPTARLGPLRVPVVAGYPRPADVAFATSRAWWVIASDPQPTVFHTADAGRHWHRHPLPVPPRSEALWLRITASDPQHAWALLTTTDHHSRLLSTSDSGRSWIALHPSWRRPDVSRKIRCCSGAD